jgi:protochlorophyllide reductase
MPSTTRVIVASALLMGSAVGFEQLAGFKMPSLQGMQKATENKAKFGDKKIAVVTGTSSGLGRATAKHLLRTGEYHVIGAVRDLDKMEAIAELDEFDMSCFTPMLCDLNDFACVRQFCEDVKVFANEKPVDRLVCNAALYQPSLDVPKWSKDGIEQQMQSNFLSHFLMISLLMPFMKGTAVSSGPRITMVGSVTGNDNTVGGGGVYPVADLKDLDGLKAGARKPIAMMDGYAFNGAKGYKDSKLALMMLSNMLHDKYHRQTGIAFSSIYPGCIAESPLFREKRPWFRKYFPVFMKYITGGFVGEEEAGQRLFQVMHDPRCAKSGVYWSWNGGPREGRGAEAIEKGGQIMGAGGAGGGWDSIYENDQSDKVLDKQKAERLWEYASQVTGAEWALANQPKSPCPTLKAVGLATSFLERREEQKRMAYRPGIDTQVMASADAPAMFDKQLEMIKGLQTKFLGELPETATKGDMLDAGVDRIPRPGQTRTVVRA